VGVFNVIGKCERKLPCQKPARSFQASSRFDAIPACYRLIRNSQHGFRKGSSCLTNILLLLDKVSLHSVNEGFSVDVVFLDLAKVFNKVPHKRL